MERTGARVPAEAVERLCRLLAIERECYRRLLALSRRQGELLRSHDVDGLQANTESWRPELLAAAEARRERQERQAELAGRLGADPAAGAQPLLAAVDNRSRERLRPALRATAEAGADLVRQNALNRELAGYCLALAREEAEIFRRCLSEDPAGRYDGEAGRPAAPPGGVIARQA